jgi:N4-(beta-N-acetylglucosaminyl)-L-asparaginase
MVPRGLALCSALCFARCASGGRWGEPAAEQARRALDEQPEEPLPLVINTWPFVSATEAAWAELGAGGTRLDAVERGCATCEEEQCDGSVGFGSVPDSTGEVTLDALIMDGPSHDAGSVACLRGIREAVGVARAVMTHTAHTLLVGEKASQFGRQMGFEEWQGRSETTNSLSAYLNWQTNDCQPNYFRGLDGGNTSCPPYPVPTQRTSAAPKPHESRAPFGLGKNGDHDTIGMIALDANGDIALATSTNGANHKVAGRVGDTPVIGSGGYLENEIGAAVGTGDGDILMRFSPAARAVWAMGAGSTPTEACEAALRPIGVAFPDFCGALVCANKAGEVGAAVWGCGFSYSWRRSGMDEAEVVPVPRMDGGGTA